VPGELQGLEAVWKRFGSKPWSQLVKPAADLARSGFAAHPYLVYIMSGAANLKRMQVGARVCVWGGGGVIRWEWRATTEKSSW